MSKTHFMSNKEVALASGVSEAEYNLIMNADAQTAMGTLDPIHKVLMSFVNEQRIEWANLNNPLEPLFQSYASLNGGSFNGLFSETLIPPNAKGDDGLYNGKAYTPGSPQSPWTNVNYGTKPIQYTYGINEKITRNVTWNRVDFLPYFKDYSLIDYVRSSQSILQANADATEYVLANKVLNCEKYQYSTYATANVWTKAEDIGQFIYSVFTDQAFPEANMRWKKTKFNTTRRNGELVLILQKDFFHKYAQQFQFSSYLKPFLYVSQDAGAGELDRWKVGEERSRIILVDELTPTTLGENQILQPRLLQPATLPANTSLVGRIIDMNAVKFGVGTMTSVEIPLSSRDVYYEETQDYCFNMCDAYVNVPILVSSDFEFNRIIYTKSVTDTPSEEG